MTGEVLPGRWIDIGCVAPLEFHATYVALAESQRPGDAPIVLCGRTAAHLCLGHHQSAGAEIECANVPIIRRPLGGGSVWLDPDQLLCVLIVPLDLAPRRPADWYEWGLRPFVELHWAFGLEVERRDRDLWLGAAKISGSGAATIGASAVIAANILYRFDASRFAACVRCPSEGFRRQLEDCLKEGITDWASHAVLPEETSIHVNMREAMNRVMGWKLCDSQLTAEETAAMADAREDLEPAALDAPAGRMIPYGIKINADTYLTERWWGDEWARVVTRGGRFQTVAFSTPLSPDVTEELHHRAPALGAVERILGATMSADRARLWAQRLLSTAYFPESEA